MSDEYSVLIVANTISLNPVEVRLIRIYDAGKFKSLGRGIALQDDITMSDTVQTGTAFYFDYHYIGS